MTILYCQADPFIVGLALNIDDDDDDDDDDNFVEVLL